MVKKVILGTGIAVLAAVFFFGRDCFSYLRTSVRAVKESVHSSVPMGFQLERARGMIKDLVPEIRTNMHVIAKEEVEVEHLEKQIAETQARLAKEKEEMLKLKGDLAAGKKSLQYGGRTYAAEQVRTDLANRFERYKTGEATLASLQGMHSARQKSVDAARQKLEGMLASRRQLQVDVENLEARSQMVAAAQTTSNYNFDDSQLGRAKELVNDLRTRLDVSERLIAAEGTFRDEIPMDQTAPANVVQQIDEHFAAEGPDQQSEAAKTAEAKGPEAAKAADAKAKSVETTKLAKGK